MTVRVAGGLLTLLVAAACGPRREAAPRASASPAPREAVPAPSQLCRLADTGVEAAIAALAKQQGADEYCEDRHYAIEDLDGDSLDDLVATFNLEPASDDSDTESFLVVFLTTRQGRAPLLLRIDDVGGETGVRYPTDVSVDGRDIVVDFSYYLPGDPDCCPSATQTARFRIRRDSLVEQGTPRQRLQRRVV